MGNNYRPKKISATAIDKIRGFFSPEYIGVFFILGLGFLLRVYQLGKFSLWYDEVISIYEAQELFLSANGHYELLTFPPLLFLYILHLWLNFGTTEFALRLLPCLLGVVSIGVFYALGRKVGGPRTALLGSLLLAISPLHIYYSRECTSYALWILMSLLSVYYFLRLTQKNLFRDWVGYTFFSIGCIYSHNFGFFTPLASGLFYFITVIPRGKNSRLLKRAACFYSLIILSSFWLCFVFFQGFKARLVQIIFWIPRPSLANFVQTLNVLNAGYNATAFLYAMGLVLFSGLFFLGCRRFKDKQVLLLLMFLLVIPIFTVALVSYWIPLYLHRYFFPVVLPYYLVIACGLSSLSRRVLSWILVLIICLSAISLGNYYRDVYPLKTSYLSQAIFEKKDYRGAGSYLKKHMRQDDIFINTSRATFGALWFYIDQKLFRYSENWIWGNLGKSDDWEHWSEIYPHLKSQARKTWSPSSRDIEECVSGQNRIWLIDSDWSLSGSENPRIKKWFDQDWLILQESGFRGLKVYLYQKRQPQQNR